MIENAKIVHQIQTQIKARELKNLDFKKALLLYENMYSLTKSLRPDWIESHLRVNTKDDHIQAICRIKYFFSKLEVLPNG